MDVVWYILAVLVIFIVAVGAMRLLGKSAIVQLTPYDLATIVLLGTVLAEPLVTPSIGRAILAGAVIVLAHIALSKLTLTHRGAKWLLGEPTILVKHGKIVERALEDSGISVAQLLALLRHSGHPRLENVEYAVLEPIGQVSVIPTRSVAPVSPADLNLPQKYQGLPLPLVADGRIKPQNLKLINGDRDWLLRQLQRNDIAKIEDVMYAAMSEGNKLFVDIRGEATARHWDLDEDSPSLSESHPSPPTSPDSRG